MDHAGPELVALALGRLGVVPGIGDRRVFGSQLAGVQRLRPLENRAHVAAILRGRAGDGLLDHRHRDAVLGLERFRRFRRGAAGRTAPGTVQSTARRAGGKDDLPAAGLALGGQRTGLDPLADGALGDPQQARGRGTLQRISPSVVPPSTALITALGAALVPLQGIAV